MADLPMLRLPRSLTHMRRAVDGKRVDIKALDPRGAKLIRTEGEEPAPATDIQERLSFEAFHLKEILQRCPRRRNPLVRQMLEIIRPVLPESEGRRCVIFVGLGYRTRSGRIGRIGCVFHFGRGRQGL